jgi:hypothetical protein
MRGSIIVTSTALALLGATGCTPMKGGAGSPAAPVTADQAHQIMQAAGYGNIGQLYRSKDDGSWETHATIDGVPYIVDVDPDGMLTSR